MATLEEVTQKILAHREAFFAHQPKTAEENTPVALETSSKPQPRTKLREFRDRHNLTIAQMSNMLGTNERTIYLYLSGDHKVPAPIQTIVALVELLTKSSK